MPHLLKRLELNGFKSFAGRTSLDFSAGISAIVGPNGSGKSNVIDAIRWLLGEREAKNLRGGKAEDLVFAGTPKRPRVGMAQASLHFENHGKFFPLDVDEITVSREVSRDGENRYFLNGAEVRLKDIIDFFAAARLGSRGITVVTQGNSDMFIRASLTERREMIEEVLGLKEYQTKKNEAERRLKNAGINLDKVKALLEEVLPHLRSLKRQTNRWEKRGEIEQELKDLENNFFGAQWQEIERNDREVKTALAAHEAKKEALAEAYAAAEGKVKEVEGNEPKEREELKVIKGKTQKLFETRSVLQKEIGRLEAQLEMQKKSGGVQNVPYEALLKAAQSVKRILSESLAKTGAEMEMAVKSALKELENAFGAPDAAKKEIPADVNINFSKLTEDLKELEEELAGLRADEQALEKNQESFYGIFKAALAGLEAARSGLQDWERDFQDKRLNSERIALRRDELMRQIAQAGRFPEDFAKVNVAGSLQPGAEGHLFKLRGELAAIGEIDQAVMKEAQETESRYEFLEKESADLRQAQADLKKLIRDLNEKIRADFRVAFVKINEEFQKFFELMFGGGQAKLKLVKKEPKVVVTEEGGDSNTVAESTVEEEDEEDAEEGVDVQVSLPRKRVNSLESLSGGERSLVGIAALFALISVSPPPFLVLDEIDAPLDERNARRFSEMLQEFSKKTQFVVVTHNRATMEAADVLYGVTLAEDGTSKILSMKLESAAK